MNPDVMRVVPSGMVGQDVMSSDNCIFFWHCWKCQLLAWKSGQGFHLVSVYDAT